MTAAVLISAESSAVNMVLFRRTTRGGRHLIYRLAVLQQPERARACGSGQKSHTDRRPIDPPPVMELRIYEAKANLAADPKDSPDAIDITFNYNANFFLYATLEHARQISHGRGQSSSANTPPVLTGMPVSGMAYLDRPTEAGYFLFPDLSVRHEGRYKLVFNLYEQTKNEADCDLSDYPDGTLSLPSQTSPSLSSTSAGAPADMEPPSDPDAHFNWRMEIKSAPFSVFSAKKFPGLAQSTDLSKTVAEQGCRVRIRREVRMRKRDGKRGGEGGDDAEYQRGRASATPEPYRARSLSNASDRTGYPDGQGRRPSVHDYQMPPPPPGYGPPIPAGSHLYFGNKPQFAQPGLLPQQPSQQQPPPQPPPQSLPQQQPSLQYQPLPPPPPVSPSTPYSRQSHPSPYQTPTQPVGPYGGGGGYGQQRSSVSHHPYQYQQQQQQQQHYQHPLPSPHDMYDRRPSGVLPPLPSPSVAYGASESDRRADYGPPSTGSSSTALPSFMVAGDHHHSHPNAAAPLEAPTPTRAAAVPPATQLPSIAALTGSAASSPHSSLPPLPASSRCGTPVQLSSFSSVGSGSHSRTKPIEALPDDAPLGPPPELLVGAGTKRKRSTTLEADDKPLYNGQRQSDPPRVDRSRNWRNTILNESSPMSTLARPSEATVEAPPAPMRTLEYTTPRFASNSVLPDVSMVIPDAVLGTYTLSATYYLTPPPPRH